MKTNAEINFFQEEINYPIRQKNALRKWIAEAVLSEGKSPGAISVILCSDDYLHRLNLKYLQHDTLTDIITFDYSEAHQVSGDLFISIDRVRENASGSAVKIPDELHRVIIHGILHLCGYGDKTAEEKKEMTAKENKYLSTRPEKLAHPH